LGIGIYIFRYILVHIAVPIPFPTPLTPSLFQPSSPSLHLDDIAEKIVVCVREPQAYRFA